MITSRPSIVVAACGNVMAAADAFGPWVVAALREEDFAGVEVVNLDINPAALLDHLGGREALIVVDAVQCPGELKGALIDRDWFDPNRPPLVHDDVLSSHGLSLAEQIQLAGQLKLLPRYVRLLALVIDGAAVGETPPDCRRQVRAAVGRIKHWVSKWRDGKSEVVHA